MFKQQRLTSIFVERVIALQASAAFQGVIQNRRKGIVAEPMKLNDARSGYQCRIYFEKGVFRGSPNQNHHTVFNRVKQGILLCTIEAMDLIDE